MTKSLKTKTAYAWASWFGFGFAPVASGTVGSFMALPLAWAVFRFYGSLGIVVASLITFVSGWMATREVLKYTEEDPSLVVIDEVVGQTLSFVFLSFLGITSLSVWLLLGGFILFRFFDIIKVWPASFFDKKVHNAFGVMMDDVVAGFYAALVLTLIYYFMR